MLAGQAIQTSGRQGEANRITALDFAKGALVMIMVFYHWINYFIGPQWPYYRYLRFLTPSFIFITGFMISNVYLSKYEAGDPRLVKRLVTRGLKLLAIFIVLNILRTGLMPLLSPGTAIANPLEPASILATFVTGSFTSKVVAFYILVPISYLLILSGILMIPLKAFRFSFHITCLCLFALILLVSLTGNNNQNLEIVAIGMLGVLAGFTPIAAVNRAVRRPYALTGCYLLYLAAITRWNVPYPLEVVGTYLSVTVIYLAGTGGSKPNWLREELILLGKYSLLGYIAQIVVLQVLAAGFRHLHLGSAAWFLSFPAGFALTVIAVEAVHRARPRAASLDRLYRAVFN